MAVLRGYSNGYNSKKRDDQVLIVGKTGTKESRQQFLVHENYQAVHLVRAGHSSSSVCSKRIKCRIYE